ncbi:DUF6547 family protein [Verrucomicrobiota bacterium sgz303538]
MSSSLELYQQFLDGLVASRGSMSYLASVAQRGEVPKGPEFATLFQDFTPEQWQLLAQFIGELRSAAFHDFLVYLSDSGYTLSHDGHRVPSKPLGNPIYADFIGRASGRSWEELGRPDEPKKDA